ncbi:unnamed protein product [Heligmosomoides polygyrus]|uniref:PHTB1_N domain-containing protein n=1 Tax=Heligmosomoides polygyrus TaxID=6339 RepID=A0A183GJI4_HELPZ|nr:unnamed protein product [Heligmosomoides polygyrus]
MDSRPLRSQFRDPTRHLVGEEAYSTRSRQDQTRTPEEPTASAHEHPGEALHTLPVGVSIYSSVLSTLSVQGRVCIGYLGTEPNLYKVPVDNRFIDFKGKIQEIRDIEASIKDTGAIGAERKSSLALKTTLAEPEPATIDHDAEAATIEKRRNPTALWKLSWAGLPTTSMITYWQGYAVWKAS